MAERRQHREIPTENRAAEHLANERTFLAWVRTNIALISLGFVLARLGPWLHEIEGNASRLMSFGALLTLLAAWRYDAVNREIEAGFVRTDRALVWFVAIAITSLAAAL